MSEFEVKEKTYNLPNEHRQVLNVIRNTSNKYITKTKLLNQLGYDRITCCSSPHKPYQMDHYIT